MVGNFPRECTRASRIACCALAIPFAIFFFGAIPTLSTTHTKSRKTVEPVVTRRQLSDSSPARSPEKLALQLTPDRIRFVEAPVGELSSQMVRLTNISEGLQQIYRIEVPGAEFRVTGQALPFVIASGTSADFTISYRPTGAGQQSGRVLIYTAEKREPLTLDLTASAVAAQQELVASVASLDFSDVPIGISSARQISLINVGTRELLIPPIVFTGDSGFSAAGPGNIKLAPGQKIDLSLNFHPTKTGICTAVLKIAGALEIPITARGVPGSSSVIKLEWEGVPASGSGYVVYRSAEESGPYEQIAGSLNATEYFDTGLAAGHTYYYVVTWTGADNIEGESSAPIRATVPEG